MIFDKSSRLGFPSQLLVPWEASLMCLAKLVLCFLMMRIALIDSVGIVVVIKVIMNVILSHISYFNLWSLGLNQSLDLLLSHTRTHNLQIIILEKCPKSARVMFHNNGRSSIYNL